MRLLGIDFGTKRLGFALGDTDSKLAVPLESVTLNGQDPVRVVIGLVKLESVDALVVGMPYSIDGEPTVMSQEVDTFIDAVSNVFAGPIHRQSEYLTSRAADILAEEVGSPLHDDALSAMIMLQEWLDQ